MDSRILTDAVLDELHGWAIEDDLPSEVVEKLEKRLRLEMRAMEPLAVKLAETIRTELAIVSSFLREYRKIVEAFAADDPRLLRAQERARANAMLEGIPNPDVAPIDLARRVLEHLLTTDRSTR